MFPCRVCVCSFVSFFTRQQFVGFLFAVCLSSEVKRGSQTPGVCQVTRDPSRPCLGFDLQLDGGQVPLGHLWASSGETSSVFALPRTVSSGSRASAQRQDSRIPRGDGAAPTGPSGPHVRAPQSSRPAGSPSVLRHCHVSLARVRRAGPVSSPGCGLGAALAPTRDTRPEMKRIPQNGRPAPTDLHRRFARNGARARRSRDQWQRARP